MPEYNVTELYCRGPCVVRLGTDNKHWQNKNKQLELVLACRRSASCAQDPSRLFMVRTSRFQITSKYDFVRISYKNTST